MARRELLVLVFAIACGKQGEGEHEEDEMATAAVTCKPVTQAEVEDTIEVTGVIATPPKVDAIVSSPVAGRVGRVVVEEGDKVAAGALLAVIEDPALPAGSIEARAGVAAARAAKIAADQEVVRQERLVTSGIGARRDLDEARAKAAAASAELEAANARSGLASQQLARRELRAPYAGVVLHLWKRTGESVDGTAATPVAEIADVSVLELRAQVPPAVLAPVREGMPATVRVIGLAEPLTAKVVRIAPAVDAQTMLATIRIEIASSRSLLVGSAATGQIVLAKRPGLVVPAAAVRRSMVGSDEVVVCDHGVARVRPVTVGQRRERDLEIVAGLAAGDEIVVDHVLGLVDGRPLTTTRTR